MLKTTNAQAAAIIREVCKGGVESDWQAGINKILTSCDADPKKDFPMDALFLSSMSGLELYVCDMIVSAIMQS